MRAPRRPRKPSSLSGRGAGAGSAGAPGAGRGGRRDAAGSADQGKAGRKASVGRGRDRAGAGQADSSTESFEKARRDRARQLHERAAAAAKAKQEAKARQEAEAKRQAKAEQEAKARQEAIAKQQARGDNRQARGDLTKRQVTAIGASDSVDEGRGQALLVEELPGGAGAASLGRREEPVKAPIEMSQRRAERQAERQRVRRRRLTIGVLCAAVAAVLVWVAGFSPLLAFESGRVEVSGADGKLVKAEQVTRSLDGYAGTPLLRLNTGAAERTVEKANPLVKKAKISRSLPNGLDVQVQVRQPVACLDKEGSCTAVDADGVKINVPKDATKNLPKLTVRSKDAAEATKSMVTVMAALDAKTRSRVSDVSVSRTGQVSFNLRDGSHVVWGRPVNNAKKARVLPPLLKQGAASYDVSAPNAPVANSANPGASQSQEEPNQTEPAGDSDNQQATAPQADPNAVQGPVDPNASQPQADPNFGQPAGDPNVSQSP